MHSPLALLKVSLVLLLIPVFLLVHVLSNISKYMAPNFTFKIVMRILEKVKVRYWPNAENIQGVEDMDFFFSMDIKKVQTRGYKIYQKCPKLLKGFLLDFRYEVSQNGQRSFLILCIKKTKTFLYRKSFSTILASSSLFFKKSE